jgi:hypothetical protein
MTGPQYGEKAPPRGPISTHGPRPTESRKKVTRDSRDDEWGGEVGRESFPANDAPAWSGDRPDPPRSDSL